MAAGVLMRPRAQLRSGEVHLSAGPETDRIHSKGFGTRSSGSLILSLPEALFLQETGRIEVDGFPRLESLLAAAVAADPGAAARWAVFRDLRSRGIAARPAPRGFDFVMPSRPEAGIGGPGALVMALSEGDRLDLPGLADSAAAARRARKRLVVGAMDGEGETTWYRVEEVALEGGVKEPPPRKGGPAVGTYLGDRVIVGEREDTGTPGHGAGYGKEVGPLLHLSLIEAAHLVATGRLKVSDPHGKEVPARDLAMAFASRGPGHDELLRVYRALRERGLVVKTGFKYGAHFRAYRKHPDEEHAPYLIHLVPDGAPTSWAEVARAVRLAHGVRKEMVFAEPVAGGCRFFRIGRVRV